MGAMKRIIEKRRLLLMLCIVLLGLAACAPASDVAVTTDAGVFFPDPNLDMAIRRAIGKYQGPIQSSDIEDLTSLSLARRNVTDLTGLEQAANLEWLEILDTDINDVSPLAQLKKLNGLVVDVGQIADMSALDSLTDLTVYRAVSFPDERLEDAIGDTIGKPHGPIYVTDLEELVSLSLVGWDVTDFTGLEYCVNLERLEIQGSGVSDLSPLAPLVSLTELALDPNQIRDLSLPDFPGNVTVLEAAAFTDRNLEAAVRAALRQPKGTIYTADLEEVTSLFLSGRKIADLTGLEFVVNLTVLEIDDNPIEDLSPLAALASLTKLVVDPEQIRFDPPIASLTNAEVFAIVDIPDENLEAALREAIDRPSGDIYSVELEELEAFSFTGIRIDDLTGIEWCTGLTELVLDNTWNDDITLLADLSGLTYLSLRDNRISDITPLANLSNLSVLSLDDNEITDIAPLADLSNIRILSLGDNQITDISPLASLASLNELHLDGNQISDVSPLASLDDLVSVWLHGNGLGDVSPLASLSSLAILVLGPGDVADTSLPTFVADTAILLAVSFPDENLEAAIREVLTKPDGPVYIHELEGLTSLSLSGMELANLAGLEYCTALKQLYLDNNEISDISPLASLVNLTDLRLNNNPLSNTSMYTNIRELEERGVTVQW